MFVITNLVFMISVSATDWLESLADEPSWKIEDTVKLAEVLIDHGVDVLDVSTGGNSPEQKIKGGPAYQAPFAEEVKKVVGDKLIVASVGAIATGHVAEEVLTTVRSNLPASFFLKWLTLACFVTG